MANKRRRLVGRVVSNKMDKTVVVAIERRKMHPIYKKVVKTTKKLMAHDESNAVAEGALVRVVESRPLSRHKRWVVEAVIESTGKETLVALPDEQAANAGTANAGTDSADANNAGADSAESEA